MLRSTCSASAHIAAPRNEVRATVQTGLRQRLQPFRRRLLELRELLRRPRHRERHPHPYPLHIGLPRRRPLPPARRPPRHSRPLSAGACLQSPSPVQPSTRQRRTPDASAKRRRRTTRSINRVDLTCSCGHLISRGRFLQPEPVWWFGSAAFKLANSAGTATNLAGSTPMHYNSTWIIQRDGAGWPWPRPRHVDGFAAFGLRRPSSPEGRRTPLSVRNLPKPSIAALLQ